MLLAYNIPNAVRLEEYAYAHARANESCHNIPKHDYEVITSSANVASNRPRRDNLHLVPNEACVVSTNPRSEDHKYSYVDENWLGSSDLKTEVTTSDNVTCEGVNLNWHTSQLMTNAAYSTNPNPTLHTEHH